MSTLLCLALAALLPLAPALAAQRARPAGTGARRAGKGPKPAPAGRTANRRARREAGAAPRDLVAPASAAEFDGDDGEGRSQWFYFKRAYPTGVIPPDARRRAWASRPGRGRTHEISAAGQKLWTPIGPAPTTARFPNNWGPTSGRINAVAVSPADSRVVIAGASTGGLWRSADGGQTFAPVSDDQIDLAVGSIAFSRSNPSVVYAGMGDLDNAYVGTGVLRSTDGGVTWSRVSNATLPAQGFVDDIAVDPTNPNRVYAAQDLSLDASGSPATASGLYVSTDGGVNWTRTLAGRARNVAIHPTNPSVLYAAMRTAAGGVAGVYKSGNGGQTWALVYASPFAAATRDVRVAVTAADPERVYVLSGVRSPAAQLRVEVSRDGGATWSQRGPAAVSHIDPGQFGYNTYLHASPAQPDTLFVGTRDIYRSTDGGLTWTNVTKNFHRAVNQQTGAVTYNYNPTLSNTHPDQQALAFAPDNPSVIYAGNDGGLSRSADGGQNFQSLNHTLSLTQFVHLSLHPTDPSISYGGTQDNGTQRRLPGTNGWAEFNEGDGGRSVINPSDPSTVFSTYVFGRVHRNRSNGTAARAVVATEASFGESADAPRMAFYPPLTGNGLDHRLYFGTWRLFVCTDCDTRSTTTTPGPTWTAPGGDKDLTRGSGDVLTAIGVSRSNPAVIYTGSARGRVMGSQDAGANWTDVSAGLPNRTIDSLTVDPAHPFTVYLTVSGYGSGHVFKTTNGGATWADISGNLPNVPTSALLIDPLNSSTLYAGTDIGVFRSTTGGQLWTSFNDGMPPAVITAFAAQASGRIQAATYGRGAYEFAGGAAPEPEPATVAFAPLAVTGSEAEGRARLTVTRTDGVGAASVDYATGDVSASERADYTTARGTLRFAHGETTRTLDVPVTNDRFKEPDETFTVTLLNPSGVLLAPTSNVATVTIADNDAGGGPSPVKWESFDSTFFVRQHYLDFLGREPDGPGLDHWRGQIDECGTNPVCLEARRVNVSAAFFLAIEFQETGYLVYRTHKAAFGDLAGKPVPVTRLTMLADSRQLGDGVVVGVGDWEARLEANKRAYFERLAASPAFTSRYPSTQSPDAFVAALDQNAGGVLTAAERADLAARLADGRETKAAVLRRVAEDPDLHAAELRKAFVLMQYFGYLRRDPDEVGFDGRPDPEFRGFHFWLSKLNEFNGNFVRAEMVKAFITSIEYGDRFGH